MNVFISIISHGHSDLINELECLSELSVKFNVVVKSNKQGDDFYNLRKYPNLYWLDNNYGLGFGQNNNLVFKYCRTFLGMAESDVFVVLNPDVYIGSNEILILVQKMKAHNSNISAINLYKNNQFTVYDSSIRKFPNFLNFVQSFLGLGNPTIIDKSMITSPSYIDWAAGSFLAFNVSHYEILEGFDEGYFMYCEDIDICYRSHFMGERVLYFPEIRAIHFAKHANRKLFSKHFLWHCKSASRFLLSKLGFVRCRSNLLNRIN